MPALDKLPKLLRCGAGSAPRSLQRSALSQRAAAMSLKRTAEQAELPADPAAAAAAAAGDACDDAAAAAAAAPAMPPVVAAAIEQLEEIWGGLPVRHKNKFRDYAYMLFVGHDAEHGETMDPHEAEEASDERQVALSAVQQIAGASRQPPLAPALASPLSLGFLPPLAARR